MVFIGVAACQEYHSLFYKVVEFVGLQSFSVG